LTMATFSGSLWGMLPFRGTAIMTWLGHFAGFVGGAVAAHLTSSLTPSGCRSGSERCGGGNDWMDTYGPVMRDAL
jgi:hypothetical protein